MKKKIFLLLPLFALLFAACDPIHEDNGPHDQSLTSEQLLGLISYTQTDKDGNAQADGNYFHYTATRVVQIYTINAQGAETVLATGTKGDFTIAPARGSSSTQTVYVRTLNTDGSEIKGSFDVNVYVATEMSKELKLIASNSGTKVWTWSPDDSGRVWGNAGNAGGSWDGSSVWWGCGPIGGTCADDFSTQMNHSGTGNVEETELGAYMVFSEDGTVKKYSKDGAEISSGTFAIKNWTGGEQTNWVAGTLHIDGDGILFPFMINSGGKQVTDFNISILTADQLVLTYYENEAGGWGEATWWRFGSESDGEGMLLGSGSKSWTWSSTRADGAVWGNAGNAGGSWDGSSVWWGCCPVGEVADDSKDFSGQMNHSGTGNVEETEEGAYMTFNDDGTIVKYSKDGVEIGSGTFEIQNFTTTQTNWNQGTLHVTGDGILFPFMINSGGKQVTDFNISGLTSNSLILTYYENEAGGWGEATWWSFGPKSE